MLCATWLLGNGKRGVCFGLEVFLKRIQYHEYLVSCSTSSFKTQMNHFNYLPDVSKIRECRASLQGFTTMLIVDMYTLQG